MTFSIEDVASAVPGRLIAVVVGGTLFTLTSSFAVTITAGFIQGGAELLGLYFSVCLMVFALLAGVGAKFSDSAGALWKWYVTASGVAIVLLPAGLIIEWFRGFQPISALSESLNGLTWYVVIACGLLGGLLIAIGRAARR